MPDVASEFEDGVSVPEPASKSAEAAPPEQVEEAAGDSFQSSSGVLPKDQAEFTRIEEKRAALKPELEQAREEALWSLAKLFPMGGIVAEGLRAQIAAGKALSEGDIVKALQAGVTGVRQSTGAAAPEVAQAVVGSPAAKGVIGAAAAFADAKDICDAMRRYGSLVRKDDALRERAEDLQMAADPSRQFAFHTVGGTDYRRTRDGLVAGEGQDAVKADWRTPFGSGEATPEQRALVERLRRGQ